MKIPDPLSPLVAVFVAASLLVAMAGCSPSDPPEETGSPREVAARKKQALASSYPLQTELTNSEGTVIKVTITGRTEKDVVFVPEGKDEEVHYALAKLSKQDRRRVGAMPLGTGPKPDPPYVASRKKALEDNKRRIRDIEGELEGPSIINATANIEAKRKKIADYEKENALLEQQIKNYTGN
jgi:hypothetical protein